MSLYCLVYISLAIRKMSDAELSELLATCRKNNRKLEVTGLLLYRDGFFIQALAEQQNNGKGFDSAFNGILRCWSWCKG